MIHIEVLKIWTDFMTIRFVKKEIGNDVYIPSRQNIYREQISSD